jgi:hypothetical protein
MWLLNSRINGSFPSAVHGLSLRCVEVFAPSCHDHQCPSLFCYCCSWLMLLLVVACCCLYVLEFVCVCVSCAVCGVRGALLVWLHALLPPGTCDYSPENAAAWILLGTRSMAASPARCPGSVGLCKSRRLWALNRHDGQFSHLQKKNWLRLLDGCNPVVAAGSMCCCLWTLGRHLDLSRNQISGSFPNVVVGLSKLG